MKKRAERYWADVLGNDLTPAEVLALVPNGTDLAEWIEQQARELWGDEWTGKSGVNVKSCKE